MRRLDSRGRLHPLMLLLLLMLYAPDVIQAQNNEFNTQVMWRVLERLEDFMKIPLQATARAEKLRKLGMLFPHQMQGQERAKAMQYLYAERPVVLYYGLEDGTFLLHSQSFIDASYREPGESGYRVLENATASLNDKEAFVKRNFYNSCVNRDTGEPQTCTMQAGGQYIQCVDGCALQPCSWQQDIQECAEGSSDDSSSISVESREKQKNDCLSQAYAQAENWCPHYTIEKVSQEEADAGALGFVPRTYSCLNSQAQPEEGQGRRLLDATTQETGNCYFEDGTTLVNRSHIEGEYQYCGGSGAICGGTFTGGYRSRDYDPRFRGWYKLSRRVQQLAWSDPYPFFSNLEAGVTFTQPMYNDVPTKDGNKTQKQFHGVWAVDYSLSELTQFLTSQYSSTQMWVLIVETAPPHNVIAASTGSPAAVKVRADNHSQPCPDTDEVDCTAIRVPVMEFGTGQDDAIVKRAFKAYQEAGYPDMLELIGFKGDDEIGSEAYVAQGQIYEQPGANNLQWNVLVAMPMARSDQDAVLPGDSSFVIVCVLASIGVVGCFLLFMIIFEKRRETAFINGDWRFTSGFILGCSALNFSTFTLLGDNTNVLCALRMWSFNLLFVCALSPLIVKVWRMHRIVTAAVRFERLRISHFHAWLLTWPIPVVEILLLTIFTIVDAPKQTEILNLENDSGVQTITCAYESDAFFITQSAFHIILVLLGCVLAYRSRDLDPRYGEAKQLGFAMYNIAFTFIIIVTILRVADIDQIGKVILQAIGVLWGTLFSAFAFVLPRLIEVQRATRQASKKTKDSVRRYLKSTEDWESRVMQSAMFSPSRFMQEDDFEDTQPPTTTTNFDRSEIFIEAAPTEPTEPPTRASSDQMFVYTGSGRLRNATTDDLIANGFNGRRRLIKVASWSSGYGLGRDKFQI